MPKAALHQPGICPEQTAPGAFCVGWEECFLTDIYVACKDLTAIQSRGLGPIFHFKYTLHTEEGKQHALALLVRGDPRQAPRGEPEIEVVSTGIRAMKGFKGKLPTSLAFRCQNTQADLAAQARCNAPQLGFKGRREVAGPGCGNLSLSMHTRNKRSPSQHHPFVGIKSNSEKFYMKNFSFREQKKEPKDALLPSPSEYLVFGMSLLCIFGYSSPQNRPGRDEART